MQNILFKNQENRPSRIKETERTLNLWLEVNTSAVEIAILVFQEIKK